MAGLERVEGRRPVLEALRAGRLRRLLVAEGARGAAVDQLLAAAAAAGIPVTRVPRAELDRMAATDRHQGVIGDAAPIAYADVDQLLARAGRRGEPPLLLVCAEIQDPQNLGSLLRTADAAGVHGVIIPRHRSAALTPAVARASAGAVEHVPVARVINLARTLEELRRQGLWACALAADAERTLYEADLTGPLAIVVGSEGRGIPRLVREKCDFAVRIPMHGRIESLNAAVAGALVMYEAVRQRRHARPS